MDPKEQLLDHFHHPQFCSKMSDPTVQETAVNQSCGDSITWYIKSNDEKVIEEATFEAEGCSFAIAGASMLASAIQKRGIRETLLMSDEDLYDLVGMRPGPVRAKCLLLSLEALRAVLKKIVKD